jgi:hypothetical protein
MKEQGNGLQRLHQRGPTSAIPRDSDKNLSGYHQFRAAEWFMRAQSDAKGTTQRSVGTLMP